MFSVFFCVSPLQLLRTPLILGISKVLITRYDILYQRNASYILITTSIAGLCFSTYFYVKTKPETKKKPLDKLIAPYKDLIIEAQEPPKTPPEATTINVKTIQELAKTAEILEINRGATITATSELGLLSATTENITLTIVDDNTPNNNLAKITPTLPHSTPWAQDSLAGIP